MRREDVYDQEKWQEQIKQKMSIMTSQDNGIETNIFVVCCCCCCCIFILQKSILLESFLIVQNKHLEYKKFQPKLYFKEARYIKRSSIYK